MISVNDFRILIDTISLKDENGSLSPAQFNSTLAAVVGQYIDGLKAKVREYQLIQNKNYTIIAKYELYLLELIKTDTLVVNQYGYATLPSDWAETKGLNYNFITQNPLGKVPYPIRECTQPDFSALESSQLNQPSKKAAIATYFPGQVKFSPKSIGLAEVIYYKKYTNPVWGYTIQNGQETYNALTSVNIPVAEQAMEELAKIFCDYLGIEIKDPWIADFGKSSSLENDK